MLKRKLSGYFSKRKYALLIVFTALCTGMITGAFAAMNTGVQVEPAINQMGLREIIAASFTENLKFLGWIILWGVNLFGFPVIMYLLFVKGASISAAVCSLVIHNGASSLVPVLSAVPYLACTIASVMLLAQGGVHCSFSLFKGMWEKRGGKSSKENVLIIIAEFIPAALLTFLGGVCETIIKVNIV